MTTQSNLFPSLLMAGYECTYALKSDGKRLDLLKATAHDKFCREDYKLLNQLGIKTVREGLSWSQISPIPQEYNFKRFELMMKIAQEEGVKQIWDLNHFDYPDYLDPFSQDFVAEFARYAKKAIRLIRKYQTGTIFIVPQNEISYYSYKGADKGSWAPFTKARGNEFKKQLALASIKAMDAIWEEDKDVRFIQVDPLFYRKQKEPFSPEKADIEKIFNQVRFMGWDILAGNIYPELGGNSKYLDIIGCNYYIQNQEWIIGSDWIDRKSYETIDWADKGRISLQTLLTDVYKRFNRPIVITETGGYISGEVAKSAWWKKIIPEIESAIAANIPIEGICAYPILDMYDWGDDHLTHPGIWDFKDEDTSLARIPDLDSIAYLKSKFNNYN